MNKQPRRSEQPQDRLTRICDVMTDALHDHPEFREGDKCMVFMDDGESAGLVMDGYDDDSQALADLFQHMQAIMKANGKKLDIIFLDEDGVGRIDG
jgi:hypothetical protein